MNLFKILDGPTEPPIIDLHLDTINESGDYSLPTPMYEFQKELTDQIVSLHYSDILKFCETNDTGDLIVKSLEICIENCQLVATHPYLLINHYMPKNFFMRDLPSKLAETSGKFNVLRDLVNVIINTNANRGKNVAIVLQNNMKYIDLVEALLVGCGTSSTKSVKRYVGGIPQRESRKVAKSNGNTANGTGAYLNGTSNHTSDDLKTNIHLVPGDGKAQRDQDQLQSTKFDLIIVFDSSVDTDSEFFKGLRRQHRDGDAVIIRLIPMRTIEHSQLFYSDLNHDSQDYLYKLISSIVCLRDHIGTLPPDVVPIYNQKLTFLTPFFDDHFKSGMSSKFPQWPLPELPKIPRFSKIDVERSLLTEVHYHYTPYDSSDFAQSHKDEKKPITKSYYEVKRLQLDYVTNPLKNDYDKLTGIQGLDTSTSSRKQMLLTHKLIFQLNNAFEEVELVKQEYESYKLFDLVQQSKFGRRDSEFKKGLSNLNDDIDHAEVRIGIVNKKIITKSEEIEKVKQEIKVNEDLIDKFVEGKLDEDLKKFYTKQKDIWELQARIKENLDKIKSKNEEKNYMNNEYENSKKSIVESNEQIQAMQNTVVENKRKLDSIIDAEEEERKKFNIQRKCYIEDLKNERAKNEALKLKLAKSLKFLKDTSHLKKRKGRGFTPNK
jgi:predicted  nucleic acid-binding Zn-ribbon protein